MHDQTKIDTIKTWLGSGSINIFGKPFSGKDYQGRKLVEIFGGSLIGGGEILRSINISDASKDSLNTGKLIPSQDYFNIVLPYLKQPRYATHPVFLSAVGRWHGEEPMVIDALNQSNHPLKLVISLNVSDEDVENRWKALATLNDRTNRKDDTLEILKTRLMEFNYKTQPVVEHYRTMAILLDIDGSKSKDEVTKDIIDGLFAATNV